ncbi:hypothetical protein FH972_021197 [Carpinus fangiana]|uniref:Acyltransferase MbtK/IucB-like conserved domain-containing protein n=1 Tax=Carpinus fangiana TaxID=176857 RepID=A0A5N6KP73_9ROSI|nr:hypothetical protein FH972_021197 [Carpinus fangiana]
MAPSMVHLPNGQTLTVSPVFGGLAFKSNEWAVHRSAFPPGWTIILNEEDGDQDNEDDDAKEPEGVKKHTIHRYKKPTLQNDHMFISAISTPNSAEFKPACSPTRQIAMMVWATLWWYFHQAEPAPQLTTKASAKTADDGKPKGEWVMNINREGIFKSKNLLAKLERMGLIMSADSSVGTTPDDISGTNSRKMFISRRAFWQMDARIYLFTLSPVVNSPFPSGSPYSSRPTSPVRRAEGRSSPSPDGHAHAHDRAERSLTPMPSLPAQFASNSHMPTYYPPHPAQYTFTNSIRHPMRPKPFRQGETFYTRYVPSVGQFLSFRVASLSPRPISRQGPWSAQPFPTGAKSPLPHPSDSIIPTIGTMDLSADTDAELLHKWMNDPRVAHFWGEAGPLAHQEEFLKKGLASKHSFPCIGCWNGKPFGYFEIYWVKEDALGKYLGGDVGDYDRGLHCLVGEQEFRGPHRVQIWLSALVHYCWLSDMRTNAVMLEPRVDNTKLAQYCQQAGFYKEQEVTFPHKQSNLMKIRRDAWEKPAI